MYSSCHRGTYCNLEVAAFATSCRHPSLAHRRGLKINPQRCHHVTAPCPLTLSMTHEGWIPLIDIAIPVTIHAYSAPSTSHNSSNARHTGSTVFPTPPLSLKSWEAPHQAFPLSETCSTCTGAWPSSLVQSTGLPPSFFCADKVYLFGDKARGSVCTLLFT